MFRWGWAITATTVAVTIVLQGDLTHFTWWQLYQFGVYAGLAAAGKHHRFVVTFAVQSLLTMLGVLAMSAFSCGVLVKAHNTWGALYVPLNFAVHYMPLLVVLAAPPSRPPFRPTLQALQGGAVFLAYVTHHNATVVYECRLPYQLAAVGLVPVVLLLVYHPALRVLVWLCHQP